MGLGGQERLQAEQGLGVASPVVLLFVSFFSTNLNAQTFIWAERISGGSVQCPHDIVVDDNGSNYSCGWTVGNTTFGSNSLSGNSYDGYVVKYDKDGDYLQKSRSYWC